MLTLTLVRHGESTGNVAHKWQGITDASLTNHGMSQAELVGKRLSTRQFTAIIVSPLKRALHTAEAIHKYQIVKPPFTTDTRLMEVNMGELEDKNWYSHGLPQVEGVPYREQRFPGGESRQDAFIRATDFLTELFSKYPAQGPPAKHILIVAHGMFLREMSNALHSIMKVPWEDIRWHNTAVTTFQISPAAGLELLEKNDTSHLESLRRQKGGIGSAAHSRKQNKITNFFGKTA